LLIKVADIEVIAERLLGLPRDPLIK